VRNLNGWCGAAGKAAMLQGVAEMFNNPHLSDVTLIVRPDNCYPCPIPAHRNILSTHSRVWAQMWKCQMLEVRCPIKRSAERQLLYLRNENRMSKFGRPACRSVKCRRRVSRVKQMLKHYSCSLNVKANMPVPKGQLLHRIACSARR
jgi:hypothetical protein